MTAPATTPPPTVDVVADDAPRAPHNPFLAVRDAAAVPTPQPPSEAASAEAAPAVPGTAAMVDAPPPPPPEAGTDESSETPTGFWGKVGGWVSDNKKEIGIAFLGAALGAGARGRDAQPAPPRRRRKKKAPAKAPAKSSS